MEKKRIFTLLLFCAVLSVSLPVVSQQNNTAGRGTAQDFNTTRSNRDNRLVTKSKTGGTNSDTISGDDSQKSTTANINTSRSNIRQQLNGSAVYSKPGQPIGGIIVKGGRNPGGEMLTMTTDENGEFLLSATEQGNYLFRISNTPTNEKGIQEAGIKNPEAVMVRVEGGDKKIVAEQGGNERAKLKTRHESQRNTLQNVKLSAHSEDDGILIEDGEFSLYIPEAGNYKIIITTPKMEHWGDPHENLNGKH